MGDSVGPGHTAAQLPTEQLNPGPRTVSDLLRSSVEGDSVSVSPGKGGCEGEEQPSRTRCLGTPHTAQGLACPLHQRPAAFAPGSQTVNTAPSPLLTPYISLGLSPERPAGGVEAPLSPSLDRLSCVCFALVQADSPSAPVNVTVRHLKANSAVVSWDVLEDEVIIGFAISQQKKDVRMLRFIQEVNTTTRSCALWDLEEDTEYIVHVQAISIQGQSPASEPLLFKTPREAEKMASKNKDEVTMKEMGRNQQLRTGEVLIIVVVLFMWAGVIALFCRQYDIIKDNEPNNNKEKTKSASETSTPEHQGGGLLRSKI
nr:fibronectin type III domain-containing protein 5 [Peromyscus maniculatus bairdii]